MYIQLTSPSLPPRPSSPLSILFAGEDYLSVHAYFSESSLIRSPIGKLILFAWFPSLYQLSFAFSIRLSDCWEWHFLCNPSQFDYGHRWPCCNVRRKNCASTSWECWDCISVWTCSSLPSLSFLSRILLFIFLLLIVMLLSWTHYSIFWLWCLPRPSLFWIALVLFHLT